MQYGKSTSSFLYFFSWTIFNKAKLSRLSRQQIIRQNQCIFKVSLILYNKVNQENLKPLACWIQMAAGELWHFKLCSLFHTKIPQQKSGTVLEFLWCFLNTCWRTVLKCTSSILKHSSTVEEQFLNIKWPKLCRTFVQEQFQKSIILKLVHHQNVDFFFFFPLSSKGFWLFRSVQ